MMFENGKAKVFNDWYVVFTIPSIKTLKNNTNSRVKTWNRNKEKSQEIENSKKKEI